MAKSPKLTIPESKNEFLTEILSSFRKRSKSLKHNSWSISIERIFEEYEDDKVEKIEIEIKPSNRNAMLCLRIWQDRWVTVSCWERTKEEKWDYFFEGKLLPEKSGRPFIDSVEDTMAKFFEMRENKLERFNKIWTPLLANGLELVK
ncbi:hypothetical protein [Aliikangiella coralliicola]|uniref:Uncharacterized protein n=1 Tax=Aliikangiella coralliicola TaxID=2592383 RepID=A0A545UCN7_9GAMM|nr:hypothetical protein [Aliikangiella coralliicola]TQV87239.1 hypothetical protein FLL46_12350 [Aliikangiella coralliicola]